MSRTDSFGLPEDLLDAAIARWMAAAGPDRERLLAELQVANPVHAEALARFAATMREADAALFATFAGEATGAVPHFDGYRVLQKLGEGAFGVVYLGEQAEPIRREVAIKVLRPGAGDRSTLARFDAERRFLARLQHPAIAQIFASGLLADGRPWFVMEHVPGLPIARYCDERRLDVTARVHLFVRLCQGVQHAHDSGIVHRDLKPANILVVDVDGQAQPKIIDFGIARALERADGTRVNGTEAGRVVGTPGYMSPEQMAGELDAIDARSDVWSLGVLLYELLTGQLPWGRRPTQTDNDPLRPSARVTTTSRDATTTAEQRNSQPRRLAAQLRGDLDWIVMKALSRERTDRYATASELAADVQRHLRGEAVLAGPPSTGYRLRKFTRRHRVAVGTLALVAALTTLGAWIIGRYQDRLLAYEQRFSATADTLLQRANDPGLLDNPGAESLRQTLADDALRCAEDLLQEQPANTRHRTRRSQTLFTLSQVSMRLGRHEEAERLARAAAADAEDVVASDPVDGQARKALAWAERNVGLALLNRSLRAEAIPHARRAVELFEQCRREGHGGEGGLVRALSDLCALMDPERDGDEIDASLQRAIDVQAGILRDHPEALFERDTHCSLALQRCQRLLQRGQFATARDVLQAVEGWISDGRGLKPATIVRAHETAALLAHGSGDLEAARLRLDLAIDSARAWLASAGQWPDPYRCLYRLLEMRIGLRQQDGDDVADDLRAMIAIGEQEAGQVPDDREASEAIVVGTTFLCELLLSRGRRGDLAGVEPWARLACVHVERLPARVSPTEQRTRTLTTRGSLGLLADALDLSDADAIWEQVAAAMSVPGWTPEERAAMSDYSAMLGLRVASHRAAAGRVDDAAQMLDHVAALLDQRDGSVNAPALARQQAMLAAARGDFAAAAAGLEELFAKRQWRAVDAAAAGMFDLWQSAQRDAADLADDYRDRAVRWGTRAVDLLAAEPASAADPWLMLPLAKARVRVALASRARAETLSPSLSSALATLGQLRDEVLCNDWDERLFRAGAALLDR